MKEQPQNRNRNLYLVFIIAGVFLLLYKVLQSSGLLIALAMLALGFYCVRTGDERKGYVLFGLGAFFLVGSHIVTIIALLCLSLGFFYLQSRKHHGDRDFIQIQKLIESMKRDREPWELKSMSLWHVIGEINLDLGLAIPEEPETTVVLQGIVGGIDIIVPEDIGLSIQSSLTIGQLKVGDRVESGIINKVAWQSPNYETATQRVKLIVSYIVGDIDIKMM